MVATEEQRQVIKNMYNHLKDNLDEIKQAYLENGYDLDNLQGPQKISVKLNESRMWMLSGLYNANRQRYNKGLRKYMRYSEEMLSNGHGFTAVKMESANHYANSEALRQCGLELKEDYDAFKIIEKSVFG
jgi:hypothetical protein